MCNNLKFPELFYEMSCIQVAACKPPAFGVLNISHLHYKSSALCSAPVKVFRIPKDSAYHFTRLHKVSLRLAAPARTQQFAPVCLFGGKGKSANDNETSPWKSLEKAMGSLKKEQSLEDVLRQQMEKQEYYDDGGSGGKRPGGGGSGGGDGFGESEDEGLSGILDEVLQVVLAFMGIIFLYIYIIAGEEVTVFAKDLIKFLFTKQQSNRLSRFFYTWGKFYQSLNKKTEIEPYWLEQAIISTPTWWDSTTKYKRILRSYLVRSSDGL